MLNAFVIQFRVLFLVANFLLDILGNHFAQFAESLDHGIADIYDAIALYPTTKLKTLG